MSDRPVAGDPAGSAARGASDATVSPLDSVSDMRAAAKWMLAAAGVVGAALISGGPLVAIGRVHGVGDTLLSLLGLLLALGGVGIAIWSASQVLVPRLTTPDTLRKDPALADLRQRINDEPAEFFGVAATSLEGLFEVQAGLRRSAASLARQAADARTPARRAQFQAALARVEDQGERVGRYVRWVLALGQAWQIRADLERSRRWTLLGGVSVIVGAVLFFSATDSNGPTYVPVLTPAPTASPMATP